jgi:CP family cyanate transporter-like MFS transporter
MRESFPLYRWVMAAVTWLMLYSLGASWFCFTSMTTPIMADLGMTLEQVGFLVALVPLALVILCIPGGLFADRFGVRSTVVIGGLIMGVFGLLRGFATNLLTLGATMFLCGVGYSIAYPNLPKVTGLWFPHKEYALASGVMFTGMEAGIASSFMLTPVVLLPLTGSWQGVFIVVGILSLIVTFIWILLARERPSNLAADRPESSLPSIKQGVPFGKSLSTVISNRHMWTLMLTCLFLLAPQIALLAFLQTMLAGRGMDSANAGLIASMISWFMIPGSFIMPMISDRVKLRKPFIWATSIAAAVALYCTGTVMGFPLWISVIVYGFLIGGMAPIILAMPVELMGESYSATAGGFTLVGGYIGAMIAPWLAGYLSTTTGSFLPAIVMCTFLTVIEAVCGLMLKETGSNR